METGKLKLIIDTREQLPIKFVGATRKTMNVGDYTTDKLHKSFAIERKSPGDLYGTMLGGHRRFRKEILRAQERGITLVVFVECSRRDFIAKRYPGSERHEYPSATLQKIIATVSRRYGVKFFWFSGRVKMAGAMLRRLRAEERKLKTK